MAIALQHSAHQNAFTVGLNHFVAKKPLYNAPNGEGTVRTHQHGASHGEPHTKDVRTSTSSAPEKHLGTGLQHASERASTSKLLCNVQTSQNLRRQTAPSARPTSPGSQPAAAVYAGCARRWCPANTMRYEGKRAWQQRLHGGTYVVNLGLFFLRDTVEKGRKLVFAGKTPPLLSLPLHTYFCQGTHGLDNR